MNKIPKLIIRLPRLSHLASLDAFLLKRQKSGSQINETEAFSHKIPRLDQAALEPKLHLPSLTSRIKQDEDEAYTQTIPCLTLDQPGLEPIRHHLVLAIPKSRLKHNKKDNAINCPAGTAGPGPDNGEQLMTRLGVKTCVSFFLMYAFIK